MSSFFGHGNPLGTQVGQLIEQATDPNLASENWALNMEICDIINETDDGPKDAVKAMKKRLQQFVAKNFNSVMFTLTILETCVKNCGKRFHIHVVNKDFLHDLIKIIGPKNDPPQVVQEKVLSLIQTWADAFRGSPDLKEVEKVYQDLKAKGIEFPMTDLDNMAPIHTPARTAPEQQPTSRTVYPPQPPMMMAPEGQGSMGPVQPIMAPAPPIMGQPMTGQPMTGQPMTGQPMMGQPIMAPAPAPGPVNPSSEQMGKLRQELDVVQGNFHVLAEMLTELSPTDTDQSNLELLQDLHRTCRQMQGRVVDLLTNVSNEEVTDELLRVNDNLNNIFLRYERFERQRTGQSASTPGEPHISEEDATSTALHPPPPSYDQLQEAANPNVGNLIDLGAAPANDTVSSSDIQVRLANMNMGTTSVSNTLGQLNTTTATNAPPKPEDADFDMFAQSRQSFEQNVQTLSADNYSNQQTDQYRGGLGSAVNARTNNFRDDEDQLQVVDKDSEYDEMEKWMSTHESGNKGRKMSERREVNTIEEAAAKSDGKSLTSSEFDKFLAERAAAVDQLPDINAATGQQPNRGGNRPSRQLQKDEEENTLFAL